MQQRYGCFQGWFGLGCLLLFSAPSLQAAVLENPAPGSVKSGADAVFGWKCTAGVLTARFDGGDPVPLVYGSTRGDTAQVCDDDDNGYVLLWNWGLLSPGPHLIEVFDDDVLFASATFTVVTTGVEFLSSDAVCTLPNFPADGDVSRISWADPTQRFELSEVLFAGPEGAPQVMGNWLTVLDFSSEDCNWNTGPTLRSGSDTLAITQQGSALSGTASDLGLGLMGIVEPDEDFLIAADSVSNALDTGCTLQQTLTFDGNFLTGELTLTQALALSGSCAERNDCNWLWTGTISLLNGNSALQAKEMVAEGSGLFRAAITEAGQAP